MSGDGANALLMADKVRKRLARRSFMIQDSQNAMLMGASRWGGATQSFDV
jgi:hypothetical protein